MAALMFNADDHEPGPWLASVRRNRQMSSPDFRAEVVSIEEHIHKPAGFGLNWYGATPYEQPKWSVKGIFPEVGVVMIAGQHKAGKTFVGLEFSLCRNLGLDFLGRRTEPGAVLWIAAEGAGEVDMRIRAALFAKSEDGDRPIPLAWTADAPSLSSADGMKWLSDAVLAAKRGAPEGMPLNTVVIDTIAAAFGVEDENDNAAAARIMKSLGDFAAQHGLLVVAIAHLGKNAESGVRGASAFGAGADAILNVIAVADPLTGEVKGRSLALAKSRRGSTGPLGKLELEVVSLGDDADGDPVTSCAVRFHDGEAFTAPAKSEGQGDKAFRESLDEALSEAGREHVVLNDGPKVRAVQLQTVRNRFDCRYVTGETDAKKKTGAGRMAWKRALDRAQHSGLVACETIGSIEMVWRLR